MIGGVIRGLTISRDDVISGGQAASVRVETRGAPRQALLDSVRRQLQQHVEQRVLTGPPPHRQTAASAHAPTGWVGQRYVTVAIITSHGSFLFSPTTKIFGSDYS